METSPKTIMMMLIIALGLSAGVFMLGQPDPQSALIAANDTEDQIILTPRDMQIKEGPEHLPHGAHMTVLEGDVTKAGPFTIRIKVPSNYRIQPLKSGKELKLTILSGSLNLGKGEQLQIGNGRPLPMGSYVVIPAKTPFFAWTTAEAVIQVSSVGPLEISYVNPVDDPVKAYEQNQGKGSLRKSYN